MTIEQRLTELGFTRQSTGGGCETAETERDRGFYIIVTDGEAGFPSDTDEHLYVGVYTEQHGEALAEYLDVTPDLLETAVIEAQTRLNLIANLCDAVQEEGYEAGFAQGIQVAREAHGCTDTKPCKHGTPAEVSR